MCCICDKSFKETFNDDKIFFKTHNVYFYFKLFSTKKKEY